MQHELAVVPSGKPRQERREQHVLALPRMECGDAAEPDDPAVARRERPRQQPVKVERDRQNRDRPLHAAAAGQPDLMRARRNHQVELRVEQLDRLRRQPVGVVREPGVFEAAGGNQRRFPVRHAVPQHVAEHAHLDPVRMAADRQTTPIRQHHLTVPTPGLLGRQEAHGKAARHQLRRAVGDRADRRGEGGTADHADLGIPTAKVDQYRPRGRPSIGASPCRSGPVIRHAILVTTWSSIASAAHIRSSAASRSRRA